MELPRRAWCLLPLVALVVDRVAWPGQAEPEAVSMLQLKTRVSPVTTAPVPAAPEDATGPTLAEALLGQGLADPPNAHGPSISTLEHLEREGPVRKPGEQAKDGHGEPIVAPPEHEHGEHGEKEEHAKEPAKKEEHAGGEHAGGEHAGEEHAGGEHAGEEHVGEEHAGGEHEHGEGEPSLADALKDAAKDEHGHGEHGHGHEHGPESQTELVAATMLVGNMACIMTLFYFVRSSDDDVRRYSWFMVANLISIFLAVLLIYSWKGLCHRAVELASGHAHKHLLVVAFLGALLQTGILWAVLAVVARWEGVRNVPLEAGSGRGVLALPLKNVGCVTFGGLCAHMTGFAWIHPWAELQVVLEEGGSPPAVLFLVPLVALATWIGIFYAGHLVRERIAGLDGVRDEAEELWDEQAADAEDEAAGLCISFLVTQALRFAIGGTMPNAEGAEGEEAVHSRHQLLGLFLTLLLLAVVLIVSVAKIPCRTLSDLSAEEMEHTPTYLQFRLRSTLHQALTLTIGWSMLFSIHWTLRATVLNGHTPGVVLRILTAIVSTYVAFGMILACDALDDHVKARSGSDQEQQASKRAHRAVVSVIFATAIMVGCSWERAFDNAIEHIAHVASGGNVLQLELWKLSLAVLCTAIILPALFKHIVPTVLAAKHEAKLWKQR